MVLEVVFVGTFGNAGLAMGTVSRDSLISFSDGMLLTSRCSDNGFMHGLRDKSLDGAGNAILVQLEWEVALLLDNKEP